MATHATADWLVPRDLEPESARWVDAPDAVPGIIVSSAATALAAFLLYSNLLVVAAQSGLIPTAAAALVPGLLLAAVLHRVVIRREPLIVDRTLLTMLAFLAVLLASAWAVEGYREAASRITTFCVEGLTMYFLVRNAVRDLPTLRTMTLAVIAAATLIAGLSVLQAVTHDYAQDFMGLAQRDLGRLAQSSSGPEMGLEDRAQGPVGEANRFAQILLMALPLAFVSWLNAETKTRRLLALACVVAILGGVVVTYSRGAFLALVVLVMLAAPLGLVRPGRVFALLLAGVILTPILLPGYAQRVLSISGVAGLWGSTEVVADGATRGRTTEMLAALAAFTDHAVLGVGPGQYLPYYSVRYQALPEISVREIAEPRRAHSLYLEMGAELGMVGLVVFMAIPLLLLRDLRVLRLQLYRVRPELARLAAAFSLVLLAYLGTGVFLHLAFERYFWLMVGLTASAAGVLEQWIESESVAVAPSPWTHRYTII